MNGYQEWLHDHIFEFMESTSFSVEDLRDALEAELEIVQQWWEEEQAELEDEADDEDDDEDECVSDEDLEEWCAEQRLKNVLPADAPNPYFAPEVLEFLRSQQAAEASTSTP